MKWRYRNEEEEKENKNAFQMPQIIINSSDNEETQNPQGIRVINNKILFMLMLKKERCWN